MYRSNEVEHEYIAEQRKSPDSEVCDFCDTRRNVVDKDYGQVKIIRNKFPYELWDGRPVVDHLLIVPHEHQSCITNLEKAAQGQLLQVMLDYHARGYNFYMRADGNKSKSVKHAHLHLIKTDNSKYLKGLDYQLDPYDVTYHWADSTVKG